MQIKTGDLLQLGNHFLLCGDALKTEHVNRLLKDKAVNLILTDPPYGVSYVEGLIDTKHKPIANDHHQTEKEYAKFTQNWLSLVAPSLTPHNSIYIFNSEKMLCALRKGMESVDCKFAQLLIWVKNHAVLGRMDYLVQHELIAYGWYGTHKFHKSKDKSVLVHPKPQRSKLHPTMKPIGLLRRLLLNSSQINEFVYDPFGGSGSTLIACEQTKRKCLMLELDPKYCEVIIRRFEKITNHKAKLISHL